MLKRVWERFRAWILSVLAALGLVTAAVVISAPTTFTYDRANQYSDGTALPVDQIAETRLYCRQGGDYQLVASEPGADGDFQVDLTPGNWECVATHVATNALESGYSNAVTRTVLPTVPPNPPLLN